MEVGSIAKLHGYVVASVVVAVITSTAHNCRIAEKCRNGYASVTGDRSFCIGIALYFGLGCEMSNRKVCHKDRESPCVGMSCML